MADACCQGKAKELEKMRERQSKVLWATLFINATMFVVEFVSGLLSHSLSLTGDSLDMLGDAIAYGSSLYVINLGMKSKARSALLKSAIMLVTALFVLCRAVYQIYSTTPPEASVMGTIGFVALLANIICLILLTKHKSDDINMSSVWLCSRNDIISNTAVLIAAALVHSLGSKIPDIVVGFAITILFTKSAMDVFKNSRLELKKA